jgi:hypothetical protein
MLPLPPIRTGHDSSKSSSFKPCASGTGRYYGYKEQVVYCDVCSAWHLKHIYAARAIGDVLQQHAQAVYAAGERNQDSYSQPAR